MLKLIAKNEMHSIFDRALPISMIDVFSAIMIVASDDQLDTLYREIDFYDWIVIDDVKYPIESSGKKSVGGSLVLVLVFVGKGEKL